MSTIETSAANQEEQYDANYEKLRNSELGVIMAEAYQAATELDPRLEDIGVVSITDPDEKRIAFARPKWAAESGKHEIHVRLEDLDEALAIYEEAMNKAPDGKRVIAERLGVDPKDVTPQLLFVHSTLHEMGHLTEYMDFEDNPGDLKTRQRAEKMALPIGGATASQLIDPDSKVRKAVDAQWPQVQSSLQVGSMDELITMQAVAYRGMTSETIAGNFATDVFAMEPVMMDQLMRPTVEPYRNYPVAA